MKRPTFPDPGERPALKWLSKLDLRVDRRYQRELSTKRSQTVIAKLVATWKWAHCLPIIVTDNCDGTWNIIDGQHRHAASLKRNDLRDLPCYIVDCETLQEQSLAFVAINRDRVQMSALQVFHAMVAAREETSVQIANACKVAGVTVTKYTKQLDVCDPGDIMCTGALRTVFKVYGAAHLSLTLKVLMAAWPEDGGTLRSGLVQGVAMVLKEKTSAVEQQLVQVLAKTDADALLDRARDNRFDHNGRSIEALAADLGRKLSRKVAA